MGFDIVNLHIPEDSEAGRVIEAIIAEEHVSPAEAVLRAIQRSDPPVKGPPIHRRGPTIPILQEDGDSIIGSYGDCPDLVKIMGEVISERQERYSPRN